VANLIVRTKAGPISPPLETNDPVQMLRDYLRWPVNRELSPWFEGDRFAPAFEVMENKDGYMIRADLPGVLEKDIEVTLTANRLVICGNRMQEKVDDADVFYTAERTYGAFTRSFTLPEGIEPDGIRAELKNGVLIVGVPKAPQAKAKKIVVQAEHHKH